MKRSEFDKIVADVKQAMDTDRQNVTLTLDRYQQEIESCHKCPLGRTRLNFVFGCGNPHAQVMFVGEGPGFDEDHQGEPFVGSAGQLLNKIIESIGLTRSQVYLANIVKCHAMIDPADREKHSNDRSPSSDEMTACMPHLKRQIEIIRPRYVVTLGNTATQALLETDQSISRMRGVFYLRNNIKYFPTYHPAALLRNPDYKKFVWEDMQQLKAALAGMVEQQTHAA